MKAEEVRERTTEELVSLQDDLRRQLWKAQFDNHTGQLDDQSSIPRLRRDIARVRTILTERIRAERAQGEQHNA